MQIFKTPINGLFVIEPEIFGDHRGFFFESYNQKKLQDLGIDTVFVQDNHSKSVKGVLRGIHFQLLPKKMAKLVRCTRGRLWDVAVDLRKDSPTYKQWFGIELSEENKKMLYIPDDFGHGFYALEDCELQYKVSEFFHPELDGGIIWNDPEIAINWPLEGEPILSNRDQVAKTLAESNLPF